MKVYSVRLPDSAIPEGENATEYIRMKLNVYDTGGVINKPKEWTFLERLFGKDKIRGYRRE